ncbi:MAG: T9SS type A sorting domain-containing protein [Bacteroidota bacterium]
MRFRVYGFPLLLAAGLIAAFAVATISQSTDSDRTRIRSASSPKASLETKRARADYFHWMLRDPAAGVVPQNARERELGFARSLSIETASARRSRPTLQWSEAGPYDVSGRTRAIAIDKSDATGNTLLAGGTSGGMYRTTDGGANWTLVSPPSDGLAVTSVAQDPRSGESSTWYYATWEFDGTVFSNSNLAQNLFSGQGIFKSTDDGQTWVVLPATRPSSPGASEGGAERFDYIHQVAVSPTGTVFAATNGYGIQRSTDGGTTWTCVRGACSSFGATYVDVAVSAGGVILASFSGEKGVPQGVEPGLHASYDDGVTWQDVTPASFPDFHARTTLSFATDIGYAFTYADEARPDGNDDVRLHRVAVTPGGGTPAAFDERTANLPFLAESNATNKAVDVQGNYNMIVVASPLDPDLVVLGTTNLFVSTDGFSTASSVSSWIGGYEPQQFLGGNPAQYPQHHPDNHAVVFDPITRTKVWSGHDGGISLTADVTATNAAGNGVQWETRERGFNVTQFFHASLSPQAGSPVAAGGSQDNGTPVFRMGQSAMPSADLSTGDGAVSYVGAQFMFVQAQQGSVTRYPMVMQGGDAFPTPDAQEFVEVPKPAGASGQLFINPLAVDPNAESVLFYPAGQDIWRSTTADGADSDAIGASWQKVAVTGVDGYAVSALTMSRKAPEHRLWTGYFSPTGVPKVVRVDDANGTATATEVSISTAPQGAWISDIAVNPDDGNEAIVVMSNYSITGLYHTTDGGSTWTAIEGNLTGTVSALGPSIRSATIITPPGGGDSDKEFYVATSTGVYSTRSLNGDATEWTQEGAAVIGNVPVNWVASRSSDGTILAATHGRASYMAQTSLPVANEESGDHEGWALATPSPNPVRGNATVEYTVASAGPVELALFDLSGRRVVLVDEGERSPGTYTAAIESSRLAAGAYVVRLRAGGRSLTQRVVVAR